MCDILNFETYILILIFTIFLLFILLKFPLSIKNDFFSFRINSVCVFRIARLQRIVRSATMPVMQSNVEEVIMIRDLSSTHHQLRDLS